MRQSISAPLAIFLFAALITADCSSMISLNAFKGFIRNLAKMAKLVSEINTIFYSCFLKKNPAQFNTIVFANPL